MPVATRTQTAKMDARNTEMKEEIGARTAIMDEKMDTSSDHERSIVISTPKSLTYEDLSSCLLSI